MSVALPESPPPLYQPPADQRLGANPMLPPHPATAALDSQYATQDAILRANIAKRYQDILQQLGYTDEQGNFIPGSISVNAARTEADLRRSSDLAAEDVTHQSQREGTLFSGYRGTATARAEYPFQNQIAEMGIDVPLMLSQLHEQAGGLIDEYNLTNNQNLAAAAQRAAQGYTVSGYGTGNAPTPGGAANPNEISNISNTTAPPAAAPGAQPGLQNLAGGGVADTVGLPYAGAGVVADTVGNVPQTVQQQVAAAARRWATAAPAAAVHAPYLITHPAVTHRML